MIYDMLEQPILTPNLLLEPIKPEHAKRLFLILQSEKLYEFIPQNPPSNVATLADKYTRWARRGSSDGTEIWLNYAVYMNSINSYVGTLQATIIEKETSYIAYDVIPEKWSQGIGKEACAGMINFIYRLFPEVNLGALVDTRNIRSWKLLESIGFIRNKLIKDADTFKGQTSDEYLYLLNRENFYSRFNRK